MKKQFAIALGMVFLGAPVAALAATGEALHQNLDHTVSAAVAALSDNAEVLHNRLTTTASDAIVAIATQGERMTEQLGDRLNAMESAVLSQGHEVISALADQLGQFEQNLARDGGDLAARALCRADDLARHVEAASGNTFECDQCHKVLALPVHLSRTPAVVEHAAPMTGEHTREVLVELGFDDGDIAGMLKAKAVGS